MTLYVFNPEHDYALANNDSHFMPLQSAVQFAHECAPFLHYLINEEEHHIFLPYATDRNAIPISDNLNIKVWGWDKLVVRQLSEAGIPSSLLPNNKQLETIHELSHRKTSIQAMDFLRSHCPHISIPRSAECLYHIDEVATFIQHFPDAILKSPYSGNGRGNLYTHGELTPTLRRQCEGVIRRQGAILAEPLYPVIQDFAMEFHCFQGCATFCGYSLFETKHYGYAGNLLLSDQEIESRLSQWVSNGILSEIKDTLLLFINQYVAPKYDGYLGVDMFFYTENGITKLNPMVEINIRMTMGMAAHLLYEQHIHPEAQGSFRLEYASQKETLWQKFHHLPQMEIREGKWRSGTISLTPITHETQYAMIVSLN